MTKWGQLIATCILCCYCTSRWVNYKMEKHMLLSNRLYSSFWTRLDNLSKLCWRGKMISKSIFLNRKVPGDKAQWSSRVRLKVTCIRKKVRFVGFMGLWAMFTLFCQQLVWLMNFKRTSDWKKLLSIRL